MWVELPLFMFFHSILTLIIIMDWYMEMITGSMITCLISVNLDSVLVVGHPIHGRHYLDTALPVHQWIYINKVLEAYILDSVTRFLILYAAWIFGVPQEMETFAFHLLHMFRQGEVRITLHWLQVRLFCMLTKFILWVPIV